jgi:hypothetical protein
MPRMRVKSDGLNLRREPRVAAGNVIDALPLAHEVEVLGAPAANRFVEVETVIGGQTRRGFVSADFLREPASPLKEALLRETVEQWIRFQRGRGLEFRSPFFRFVGEFWRSININHLDGRDRDQAWSAAFISFVVRRAGYQGFRFSDAHWRYIVDAGRQRQENATAAPFWLFRLGEHRPQVGDLLCARRQGGVSFDSLPPDGFLSHCDVVVEVRERESEVRVVGGNVAQSVSMSTFALDANGFVAPQGPLIAIMRNNN